MSDTTKAWKASEVHDTQSRTTGRKKVFYGTYGKSEQTGNRIWWEEATMRWKEKAQEAVDKKWLQYFTFQREEGGETGYEHFQYFGEINRLPQGRANKTFDVLKRLFGRELHIRLWEGKGGPGTSDALRDYACNPYKPDGTFRDGPWEFGKYICYRDKREDNVVNKQFLVDAKDPKISIRDMWEKHTGSMMRYCKSVKECRADMVPIQAPVFPFREPNEEMYDEGLLRQKCRHRIYIGPTNTGKTTWRESLGFPYFLVPLDDHPFDDWNGQQLLIWEDHAPELKRVLALTNTNDGQATTLPARYIKRSAPPGTRLIVYILVNPQQAPRYLSEDNFQSRFRIFRWHGRSRTQHSPLDGPPGRWVEDKTYDNVQYT